MQSVDFRFCRFAEYFFTRERVTDEEEKSKKVTLHEQFKCCLKSRSWVVLMLCLVIVNFINALFNAGTFYYCNWVYFPDNSFGHSA